MLPQATNRIPCQVDYVIIETKHIFSQDAISPNG